LNNRASDLSGRLDGIGQALQTLKAADKAIQAVSALVTQAKALANNSLENVTTTATVTKNAADFNIVMAQINLAVNDAGYKGTNLLQNAPDNLIATFNENGSSSLTVSGTTSTFTALGLATASCVSGGAAGQWDGVAGINVSLNSLTTAMNTLRSTASSMGTASAIIQTRQDFATNLINTLKSGADKLTLADMNEEAANMLALQTQRQMGTNSLSMASQAAQSVLQMFR